MARIKTHYDNLKVNRQAPQAVIKAAYRALCQIEHPDRNPGTEAQNRMAMINASYEVLSDPVRRAEHDKWIADQEAAQTQNSTKTQVPQARTTTKPPAQSASFPSLPLVLLNLARNNPLRTVALVLICFLVTVILLLSKSEEPQSSNLANLPAITSAITNRSSQNSASNAATTASLASITPAIESQTYPRPPTAPNGEPWPVDSGPINGYALLAVDGLSTITIDNTGNSEAIYLKLVQMPNDQIVRQLYIAEHDSYTIPQIDAGTYVLRYKALGSPKSFESESIVLQQSEDSFGSHYSKATVVVPNTQ